MRERGGKVEGLRVSVGVKLEPREPEMSRRIDTSAARQIAGNRCVDG